MTDSILNTIKKLLGLDPEYDYFDMDLIIHINSVLRILQDMGVELNNYSISSTDDTWTELLGEKYQNLDMIKSYIYIKVRLIFDPPTSSAYMTALENNLKELETRIFWDVDVYYTGEKSTEEWEDTIDE